MYPSHYGVLWRRNGTTVMESYKNLYQSMQLYATIFFPQAIETSELLGILSRATHPEITGPEQIETQGQRRQTHADATTTLGLVYKLRVGYEDGPRRGDRTRFQTAAMRRAMSWTTLLCFLG